MDEEAGWTFTGRNLHTNYGTTGILAFPKSYRLPWLESRRIRGARFLPAPAIGHTRRSANRSLNLPVDSTADREQTFNVGTLPAPPNLVIRICYCRNS